MLNSIRVKMFWSQRGLSLFALLSFYVLIILLNVLANLGKVLSNFEETRSGFLPQEAIVLDRPMGAEELKRLVREGLEEKGVPPLLGSYQTLSELSFALSGGQTFARDVGFLGLDYRNDSVLKIFQDGRLMEARLSGYRGGYSFDIESPVDLKEGGCILVGDQGSVDMEASHLGAKMRLSMANKGDPTSQLILENTLYEYVCEGIAPQFSGIGWDRFERGGDTELDHFRVFKKRFVKAYAGLIYGGSDRYHTALMSPELRRAITELPTITSTGFTLANQKKRLIVLDEFHFYPEIFFRGDVVLLHNQTFRKIFGTSDMNLILFYEGSNGWDKTAELLTFAGVSFQVLTKRDLMPGYFAQRRVILFAILGFYSFLPILVLIGFAGKFVQVFQVQKEELVFLKICGFRGLLFSLAPLAALPIAILAAFFSLRVLLAELNEKLMSFFYPHLSFNWMPFGMSIGICLVLLLLLCVFELVLFKRLSVSRK